MVTQKGMYYLHRWGEQIVASNDLESLMKKWEWCMDCDRIEGRDEDYWIEDWEGNRLT